MAQIPLLHAHFESRTETGNIRAGGLERGEGIFSVIVVEIIVASKNLVGSDMVIETDRELIATVLAPGNRRDFATHSRVAASRRREALNIQLVHRLRSRINTLAGNHVIRKNILIGQAIGRQCCDIRAGVGDSKRL